MVSLSSIVKRDVTPKVSFIIPVRNEAYFIEKCLDALLSLDYPKDCVEILCAEGGSTDNSREILDRYSQKHQNIKVLDNPSGNTATGRNICIDNATGDMLMNFSGHTIAPSNLLNVLALKLASQPNDIAGVGCSNVSPEDQNFVGRASGSAFLGFMGGSGVFMQNTVFEHEKFVEHMAFTCYRKEVFDRVGQFDQEFWCGQDAELDIRVKKGGYKILYTPEVQVLHYKRTTVKTLFRQQYRYGIARKKMIKKHPDTMRIFHLFPSSFLVAVVLLGLLWWFHILPFLLLALGALTYVMLCTVSTAAVIRDPLVIASSTFFYLLITVAYGLGFIRGIANTKL